MTALTNGKHVLVDLEQNSHTDVVFGHHSVQHDLRALGVGHGHLVELHGVFLDQRKPAKAHAHLEVLLHTDKADHVHTD